MWIFRSLLLLVIFLSACKVGPNYHRAPVEVPVQYKEVPEHWKVAKPQDLADRGCWWEIFQDPILNDLEGQVDVRNQNLVLAKAQFLQALALVNEARANFFPTVSGTVSALRERPSAAGSSSNRASGSARSSSPIGMTFSDYLLSVDGSWMPDLWGSVQRSVESSVAGAQASAANVAEIRLSTQATLAQTYFELRTLDLDQKLLENTVKAYQKDVDLTEERYAAGVSSQLDIEQAVTQLKQSQAQALDNKINRAQFEHAIAVLIGMPPATFSIKPDLKPLTAPVIPVQVPSVLLERRPDIAKAERQMQQANAQIGVAVAAFYPTLTLTGTGGYEGNHLSNWLTWPAHFWSLGAQLADPLFEGGFRIAQVSAAKAVYQQNVANYRQVVLSAFQNVEDELVALRILRSETVIQEQAAAAAERALKYELQRYWQGTDTYLDVIVQQTITYTNQKEAIDSKGREMTAAVGLITALGGGWDACLANCITIPGILGSTKVIN